MRRKLILLPAFTIGLFANAQLVINEVDYDQLSSDDAEYLELKNNAVTPWDLSNVSVLMYNGATGAPVLYRTIADPTWPVLAPGGYFTICTNTGATANCDAVATPATNLIQNGPMDAIVLMMDVAPAPVLLDVLSYAGTLPGMSEGVGTTAEDTNDSPGVSIGRFPDGSDTEDNDTDFRFMCSTPGAANVIDPVQCDLSTGIRPNATVASSFTVLLAPGGSEVMVFDRNASGEQLSFDVFTSEGQLLATRGASTANHTSWNFGALDQQGRMLLVRLTTPTRLETRRIVLP